MNFTIILIISLSLSIYGIIAKRLGWIYSLNSMNNTIPMERRVQIDWNGYANFFGNIFSVIGFLIVFSWIVFSLLGITNCFSIIFIIIFLILSIWGQIFYAFKRFDKALPELKREKMRIKILEYYNLDLIILAITIILILLKFILFGL